MGAFMYFGLVLTTVLFIGGPLVLFRLMLETLAQRAPQAASAPLPSRRTMTLVRYASPSSGSAAVCL